MSTIRVAPRDTKVGKKSYVTRQTEPMALGLVPRIPDQASPPASLGDFTLLEPLARGGMSSVYLAEHTATGERVAIKILSAQWAADPDAGERLLAEHEFRQRAHHGGLVQIRGAYRSDDGLPFLVMELLDGENLGKLLECGRIEIGAAVAIGAQIADATAALHAARVAHCDLKPDNVMVLYSDGLAGWPGTRVLDLGVARDVQESRHEIAGTPCYMAPEQWRGHAELRSDVYGLGCTMYELITGAPPFEGSVRDVRHGHCDERAAAPSTVRAIPPELDRLILRMLSKDPRMRPRMSYVARALSELAFEHPPGALTDDASVMVTHLKKRVA